MTKFNPAAFRTTSNKPAHVDVMFQGPIQAGKKLPLVKKHKTILAEDAYLVGYPGKVGCFSVRLLPGDDYREAQVDVAFYTECDPKNLGEVDLNNAIYEQYAIYNGWGFAAMGKLKQLLDERTR